VFGAAAAAASLMRLGHDQAVWAFGNAGTQAAGLWQVRHEDVMSKQWHTGRAAQAGVQAADLARAGLSGPATILEGPQGFMAALGGGDAARVAADPDALWKIHEVSFKPWPACRHAHPAIDAALLLRAKIGDRPVETIEILTYGDALRFCDRAVPASVIEAKFSLQHSVATVLARGAPVLADFAPEALARPAVAALRARTVVAEDAGFEAAYPAHFGAEVRVGAGGERFVARVDDALGDPENPLDADAIAAKARTLMAHAGWPAARIEAILAATGHLPHGGHVAALTAHLP
jgi:2-methylcitrate dehydratase PrpD